MNRKLLEAAKDIVKYVRIINDGTMPLTLMPALSVIEQEERAQVMEDLYYTQASEYHLSMMKLYYGGE
jgi:hypothetical protein